MSRDYSKKHLHSVVLGLSFAVLALFYWFDRNMFDAIYSEYLAGLLGIIFGFAWVGSHERGRQESRARQILKSIKEELQYDIELIALIREQLKKDSLAFGLLKTNTWDIFKERLDVIENFDLVIDLGML